MRISDMIPEQISRMDKAHREIYRDMKRDSLRSHEGQKGRNTVAGASAPSALSRNPVALSGPPSRRDRPGARSVHTEQVRPDFWDFVYWAGWGFVGFLMFVLGASVGKAIRYGMVTDIINWMVGR